jgi:CRISPR/Cas system-associated exonuclease Cas4 (RecB family)
MAETQTPTQKRHRVHWRPRASSLGYYAACDARALWDREHALELEALGLEEEREHKPAADLGTVEHFLLQDGVRAKFPGDPREYAPDRDTVECAASLFGGDEEEMFRIARKTVTAAAPCLPVLPDKIGWRAEVEITTALLSGHIDFLSSDRAVIVDLKTTSRPPENKQIKREHLIQMYAYYLLVRNTCKVAPLRGVVIYVDSRGGSWTLPIHIDFTTHEAEAFAGVVQDYIRYLRSRSLEKFAFPRLSTKCKDLFCPYFGDCHKLFVPPPGTMSEKPEAPTIRRSGLASLKEML